MSRVGKQPITVPGGVKVDVHGNDIAVEGPLGKLEWSFRPEVVVEYDSAAARINVSPVSTTRGTARLARALHGLTRALIQNMVTGVTQGYEKRLEIVGVGYQGNINGSRIELRVGFANEIHKEIPAGLNVTCPDTTHVVVKGTNKQMVGQFAAEVRAVRKPEPYKGKGIRYEGEAVRRKAGKAVTK